MFNIQDTVKCDICCEDTAIRLRHLVGCSHFKFCKNCSGKNIICRQCFVDDKPLTTNQTGIILIMNLIKIWLNSNSDLVLFDIEKSAKCDTCNTETDIRLRQMVECGHLRLCRDCATKNIICKLCAIVNRNQ